MGASHTTKKRRKKHNPQLAERAAFQAAVETTAELMARLLEKFTREELAKLASSKEFICVDLARNLYRVGRFNLQKVSQSCWIVKDSNGRVIHNFFNCQAAVFYCLYESRQAYKRASEFLQTDIELGRTHHQVNEYLAHLRTAVKNKDCFKQDLYTARLSWAKPKLELLESNLQKSITSAKYSKVWETNNHETARTRN
jgi:hypothetical protein